jgi:hypothetical protein
LIAPLLRSLRLRLASGAKRRERGSLKTSLQISMRSSFYA